MSKIDKLSIRGIRSFDPFKEVKIEFFSPLTLIQGQNGSGKTTIIECLKMATCGSLPPLSTNGKTFLCDPKLINSSEVKSSIKLKFHTPRDNEVLVVRNFHLIIKNSMKYEFKRLEQILKSRNSKNELVTINSTCIDIDKQVPLLMHASKSILENVIFCHQEDTNWPFSESSVLKKVFDEIFDTTKYTKSLEDLKDTIKEFTSNSKDLTIKIELLTKDYDQFRKLSIQKEHTENKINELNLSIQDQNNQIEKSEKDLEKIKTLEETTRKKEIELINLKSRLDEINRQINSIKSEPYFCDYTENEDSYNNYINKNRFNSDSVESSINSLRSKIYDFKQKDEYLQNEVSKINATIKSNEELYKKYVKNKIDIFSSLNQCDNSFNLELDGNTNSDTVTNKISLKIKEIKEKICSNEEKKVIFESKLNDKLKDMHLKNGFLEKLLSDIKMLKEKEDHYMVLAKSSDNTVNNNLMILSTEINRLNNQISNINSVQIPDVDKEIEREKTNMINNQQIINQYNTNYHSIICNRELFNQIKTIYNKFREKQISLNMLIESSYFSKNRHTIESLNLKKRERDEIFTSKNEFINELEIIKSKIFQVEKFLDEKKKFINEKIIKRSEIIEQISSIFKKLKIKDLNFEKLYSMNEDLSKKIENLNFDIIGHDAEIRIREEMLTITKNNKSCDFCNQKITPNSLSIIEENITIKIDDLSKKINSFKENLEINNLILYEIKKSQPEILKLNELKNIIEEIEIDITNYENQKNFLLNEKTIIENKLISVSEKYSSLDKEINYISQYLTLLSEFEETKELLSNAINQLNFSNNLEEFEEKYNEIHNLMNIYDNISYQINITNEKVVNLQTFKSSFYEQLNNLNHEVRLKEKEKTNYIQNVKNIPDIMKRLDEVKEEIARKLAEKGNLELENISENEKYTILLEKQREFISILNQSMSKNNDKMGTLNHLKIKLQISQSNIDELNQNQNSIEENRKALEEAISKRVGLKTEIEHMEKDLRYYEEKRKNTLMTEAIYKNNILLYQLKHEKTNIYKELKSRESIIDNKEKLIETKDIIVSKINQLRNQMNINKGKVMELNISLNKLSSELRNNNYTEIEVRLNKLKTELIVTFAIIKNAQEYYEAIDQSLLKYHSIRMEEINKLINYYWSMTYKGNDIRWIEIRSDVERTLKSRSYNYRIVFGAKEQQELDMRGRCSAGQKMLASIIIRLALAETFCNSCGILCLDEPTTNLDEHHIKSLAKSLRDLIQSRADNNNFQLVVITHDPTFIDLIGSDFCDSYYHVHKNENNFSSIEVKSISSTFK